MTQQANAGPLREVVRHSLIYGSGYVTMAAVSLIVTPIYARHLDPGRFGLLALMLVFYGLMKQIYDLGFMNSVGRFYFDYASDDDVELRQMRSTGNAFMAGYGGALTLVLVLLAGPISALLTGTAENADLVRIVALTLYAEALAIVPMTMIRMQQRSGLFVRITIARFVGTLVLAIVFVAELGLGVQGALLAIALPTAGILVLLLPEFRLSLGARPSRELLRRMLSFGLPFFPVLLSAWVIDGSDRLVIEAFRTRPEVGTYALAYRIGAVMLIVVTAFSMGWAPLRYKIYGRPDAQDLYRRVASYYVLGACLIGTGVGIFAQDIVDLIAPPSYSAAGGVVPLIVLAYGVYGMNLLLVTGMGVTKRTVALAPIAVLGAVVNVGLNLLFVPEFGIKAAALSTIFAFALMAAGSWRYSQRAYPIPYEWSRMLTTLMLAIGCVAAAAMVGPEDGVISLAWGCALWIGFAGTLILSGLVDRSEMRAGWGLVSALRDRWAGGAIR
ncbi:MAG: oligosaccharide flippase family protein [Candidatus Limnocylindrales bacterium]